MRRAVSVDRSCSLNHKRPRFYTAWTRSGHDGTAYSITSSARARIDGRMAGYEFAPEQLPVSGVDHCGRPTSRQALAKDANTSGAWPIARENPAIVNVGSSSSTRRADDRA